MSVPEPSVPEPIAITGMACRFAGGIDSLESFWSLLNDAGDTVGDLPADRWEWYASRSAENAAVVRDVTKHGAFLDDVQGFDAEFFGITPREAALMDPQQRIVLELSWEALEHAGIPPHTIGGTDAGVFMGVGADDYGRRMLEDLPRIEAWTGIGGAYCAVANRVSYTLDLRGPSMVVDTACSSSLVSVHLAVQALRAGECPVALAGGVLVMAGPGLSVVLDAAGATSPDGRSKSFDASADGYGRGEGAGVIVLKKLSDARRDGDRVLAVIRGAAVHQDGRTNGIMAPNGEAQAHLMRRAYEGTGIDPATVGYVEAHGTGTSIGDPLEAGAMASVFGHGRPADAPCLIGSVKPNIGHLEAGAGIAGVIKTVLALRRGVIPPTANFTTPNPAIPWDTSGLRVVTEPTPWPSTQGPHRAGVSGYGYGGTIAHVILEEGDPPPARPTTAPKDPGQLSVYPLSGASEAAVADYAGRLADWLADADEATAADLGHSLGLRAHLPHRAAVIAAGRDELRARLTELAESGAGPWAQRSSRHWANTDSPTVTALPENARRDLVWVFSGHGSQWIGMTRELLDSDPVYAAVIAELEPIFEEEMGVSPSAVIRSIEEQPVDVIQPMIFAVQVALAEVWKANGIRPDAVIGHSVGEIAAAVTAGMLTLEHGARLVCRRSVLLRRVAGVGAMALVNLSPEETERRLDGTGLAVAVSTTMNSAVISGDTDEVRAVCEQWSSEGIVIQRVDSDVAFHSPHMDPLLDELSAAAGDLPPTAAAMPVYSTALLDPRSDAPRDGAYWATNLRGQVRFAGAVAAAAEDGYRMFLEVSPHPVVAHSITDGLDELGVRDAYVAHSLRRGKAERETLLDNLAGLYCHGVVVDWTALWPDGRLVDLPRTAWQHKPHWLPEGVGKSFLTQQHNPESHNLLGGRVNVRGANPTQVWLTLLDMESRPYPGRHPVRGVEIVPAAVLLNSFLTAASTHERRPALSDVSLRVPVSVTNRRTLQVVLQDGTLRLSSRIMDETADRADGDDKGWVAHTTAAIDPFSGFGPATGSSARTTETLSGGYVIDRLATLGVADMGFRWVVEDLARGEDTLVATVLADDESGGAPATWAPLLDAALSTASVVFPGAPTLRMPAHIHQVALDDRPPVRARVTVRIVSDEAHEDTVDVEIADLDGTVVGRLDRLRYGVLDSDVGVVTNPRKLVHRVDWRPIEVAESDDALDLVLVGPDSALLGRLTERLGDLGIPHRLRATPEDLHDGELTGRQTVLVVPPAAQPGTVDSVAADGSWLLTRTVQRVTGSGNIAPATVWSVTQGVRECADDRALGHSPLWGVGRIVGGEHPELWGGTVDLGTSPKDVPALLNVLRAKTNEDVVVVRDGTAATARLARLEGAGTGRPLVCQPDGTYLITGGLGVLGLEVAHWLAELGMRRVVLAGRRALPARDTWSTLTDPTDQARVESVRSLERLGVTVVTVAVDIADRDAVERALDPGTLGLPPFQGVVHAAGVLDNRMLDAVDEGSLATVLRPKVGGAVVLDQVFPPGSLDFFVLFSSCGYLLGLPGQTSYAAGNAFLDGLAARRRAAGDTAAVSLGWTSWRGLGMSTSTEIIDLELAARGTADISPAEAFGAWDLAARHELGYAAVLRTLPPEPGARTLPLLADLPEETAAVPVSDGAVDEQWVGLDGQELRTALVEEIRAQVAGETGLLPADVDAGQPLIEMGLDSVMTVRIRRRIERRFGFGLPATLFWDRPTIDAVAGLIAELLAERDADAGVDGADAEQAA